MINSYKAEQQNLKLKIKNKIVKKYQNAKKIYNINKKNDKICGFDKY